MTIGQYVEARLMKVDETKPRNYNSQHEFYSILLEEIEEARENMESIRKISKSIFSQIRSNDFFYTENELCKKYAENLINECIDILVVLEKFKRGVSNGY